MLGNKDKKNKENTTRTPIIDPAVTEETVDETTEETSEIAVAEPEKSKTESAVIYSEDEKETDLKEEKKEDKPLIGETTFTKNPVEPARLELAPSKDKRTNLKPSSKALLYVILSLIVVVIIIGLLVFLDAGFKDKFQSPLTLKDQSVTSDEFSFMYHYVLIENGVDVFDKDTKDMMKAAAADPQYENNREYFLDLTAQEIQITKILYDDAVKNGYEIEDKHYAMAQSYIDWLQGKADELNVPLKTYIAGVFGSQVTEQCVLDCLAKKYFTEEYASDAKLVELQASEEQATEAYEANRNAYDLVSYKILRITYEQREEAIIKTAMLHAQKITEAMGNDPSKFEEAASAYFSGDAKEALMKPDSRLVSDARFTDFEHNEFRDWLFDLQRKPGDTNIFTDEDGFPIILCFVGRKPESVPLRNVRIIEISTSDEVTLGDAQVLAQEVYDYIDDEISLQSVENRFTDEVLAGSLKVSASTDTYPGKFGEPLNSWIFFDSRKKGDKDILESENGFYVLYFISESDNPEWYDRVNSFIRMNNYESFLNEKLDEYTYKFDRSGLEQIYDVP